MGIVEHTFTYIFCLGITLTLFASVAIYWVLYKFDEKLQICKEQTRNISSYYKYL